MNSKQIARIFDSGFRAVFVVTGGGSGALHSLFCTPGASRFVVDARIPYSSEALEHFLGEVPKQFVSPETAVRLARQAFKFQISSFKFLSIACTAALQTDRKRRGDDRAFICIKTETSEKTYALYFSKTSRAEQEALLSDWLLILIAQAVGAERGLMLPGSFNPVHKGHFGMLKAAEEITGLRGVFELSAANVDKPELQEEEILSRASAIRDIPVALTHAPRFTQKAKLFSKTTFVLGYDTAVRLIEYNHTFEGVIVSEAWKNQWEKFQTLETKFLVAGRLFQCSEAVGVGVDRAHRARLQSFQYLENGHTVSSPRFQGLENLKLPKGFELLFESIPEGKFREDISSTELRS